MKSVHKKYAYVNGADLFDEYTGYTLHRIQALVDIPPAGVRAGDLGGYVLSENNLSQEGDCWVGFGAKVYGNARVTGHALISGTAIVCESAHVSGRAKVQGGALVCGRAVVDGRACVFGKAVISGNAHVTGRAKVQGSLKVRGHAHISGNAYYSGNTVITGDARISRPEDILHVELSSHGPGVTVYPSEQGLLVTAGLFEGTAQEYMKQEGEKARLIIELAELNMKEAEGKK